MKSISLNEIGVVQEFEDLEFIKREERRINLEYLNERNLKSFF